MVGLCHWLAARSLLHGLHPTLDGVQDQHHRGNTPRGNANGSFYLSTLILFYFIALFCTMKPFVFYFIFFHSVFSCSPLRLMICPKLKESRRGYWQSSLLRRMPLCPKLATLLSRRKTPPFESGDDTVFVFM